MPRSPSRRDLRHQHQPAARPTRGSTVTMHFVPIGTKAAVPRLPAPWNRRPRLNDRCSRVGPGEALLVAGVRGCGQDDAACRLVHERLRRLPTGPGSRSTPVTTPPGDSESCSRTALGAQHAFDDLDGRHCSDTVVLDRIFEDLDARAERRGAGARRRARNHVAVRTGAPFRTSWSSLPRSLSVVLATACGSTAPARAASSSSGGCINSGRPILRSPTTRRPSSSRATVSHLDPDDIESLRIENRRVGRWTPAGRARARRERRSRSRSSRTSSGTEALISDYLVRQVLDSLPRGDAAVPAPDLCRAGLDRDLARELSGDPDSDARLAATRAQRCIRDARGRFDRSYQVHALFGELLRTRLRHDEPELARSLLSRAARWFVAHDMPVEAERHAYEADDLKLAGTLSCRRFVRETVAGTWVTARREG